MALATLSISEVCASPLSELMSAQTGVLDGLGHVDDRRMWCEHLPRGPALEVDAEVESTNRQ